MSDEDKSEEAKEFVSVIKEMAVAEKEVSEKLEEKMTTHVPLGIDDVELGQKVECITTGFVGIIEQKIRMLHGAPRVGLLPAKTRASILSGKPDDGVFTDVSTVKIIDKRRIIEVEEAKPGDILGKTVKDTVRDFQGIVTQHSTCLSGCSKVFVAPTNLDRDGYILPGVWFFESQVEVQKNKPIAKAGNNTLGAPMETMSSQSCY